MRRNNKEKLRGFSPQANYTDRAMRKKNNNNKTASKLSS
jgi:hypothetical protein